MRDIKDIQRLLDDPKFDIISYRKRKIKKLLQDDPDITTVLGQLDKKPLNKYADANNPTKEELEERYEIEEYNKRVSKPQILDYLKINDIQTDVVNFIMFDIAEKDDTYNSNYFNKLIIDQSLEVMCLVHEDDMETEYDINRVDLLSSLVKDLLCWTNELGFHLELTSNTPAITDTKYYGRTLKFNIKSTNTNNMRNGMRINTYDNHV